MAKLTLTVPETLQQALDIRAREEGVSLDQYVIYSCLLYTSPSPRDLSTSRMPSSA